MARARGYLPTLDGWRAIAVLCVVLYHDALHAYGPLGTGWFYHNSSVGVDIFFGISGILICSRLLEEEYKHNRISLLRFYIRRAFRILPAFLVYLVCAALLAGLGAIPLARKEWLASLFFCRNYNFFSHVPGHNDWYTGHFWSLAVEEHFYLLLPGLLVLVPKRWRIATLGGLAIAVEAWRVYQQQSRPWLYLFQHTDIRLDALLIPAMAAILLSQPLWYRRLAAIAKFWPLAALAVVYLMTADGGSVGTELMVPFLMPWILLGTMLSPGGLAGRFLELPLLRWIGRLSYSLYIWQQLFFNGHYFHDSGFWQKFPLRWVLLVGFACASYYGIEKPMMRLGRRLAQRPTPRHASLLAEGAVQTGDLGALISTVCPAGEAAEAPSYDRSHELVR